LFHAATWAATATGLGLLWRAGREPGATRSTKVLVGSLGIGWGLFNLVEGVVDHHVLGIHHVNEAAPPDQWLLWDLGFLALGALLVVAGLALVRAGRRVGAPSDVHRG